MKKLLVIVILNLFFSNIVYSEILNKLICTQKDDLTETHKVYEKQKDYWCWKGTFITDCRWIKENKDILFLGYKHQPTEDYKMSEYISINRYTGEFRHTTIGSLKNGIEKQYDYYGYCIVDKKIF